MTCEICGRATGEDENLCVYHSQALKELRRRFEDWQKAMHIDWSAYLGALIDLEETGSKVKEVIEHLRSQDDCEAAQ